MVLSFLSLFAVASSSWTETGPAAPDDAVNFHVALPAVGADAVDSLFNAVTDPNR